MVTLSGCKQTPPTSRTPGSSQVLPTLTANVAVTACREWNKMVTPGPGYGLPGSLAYTSNGIHLIGGTPLADRSLLTTNQADVGMVGFSPDGKWFAYYVGSAYKGRPYKLHLISMRGEEIVTVPEYEIVPVQAEGYAGGWGNVYWITNEYMRVEVYDPAATYSNKVTVGILNAFTGEWNETLLESLSNRNTRRYHIGALAFGPGLKRILYVARYENDAGFTVPTLMLWDLENQMELWRDDRLYGSSFTYGGGDMAWSPDGSVIAFVGPEAPELSGRQYLDQQGVYILDRDGVQLQLITRFLSHYNFFFSYGLNWSPDGRYLAFILLGRTAPGVEATDRIYLYDSVTDQITYLCQRQQTTAFLGDAPVWSPDSRYLAYIDWKDSPQEVRLAKVIDIYTGEVVTVAEHIGRLGGWSGVWP